ncbi:MAG: hypothetical protein NPINA01_02350 [Nitrospinaceae bacterium]|nr:MAG: hypothetical protein NPINA01_02350 [Nitrospinaceae bacterium]
MDKLMNFILGLLNMTCKDTSPLISEMMDHRISVIKRLKIKIHLAMCEVCLYYKEQLETIRKLSKNLCREDAPVKKNEALNPETKEKIQKMIEANK